MSYEENVRAILQACFSQSKDEVIENAVKLIVSLKQEPIVINPTNPLVPQIVPLPYYEITTPSGPLTPTITCKNSTKSEN